MKSLHLLRHAKSSWDETGLADHDRPLAPRGRRAAKALAGHLRQEGVQPALVLCSSARRARETLERIAPALGEADVEIEDGLYGATEDDLLERLRTVPDSLPSAMLIGHNPAIQALALCLAGSGAGLDRIAEKFPTGALATLVFESPWRELGLGDAELDDFVRPRNLG